MDQWAIILQLFAIVVLCLHSSYEAYEEKFLSLHIDCGASIGHTDFDTGIPWYTDRQFLEEGENKLLTSNMSTIELSTLRFFPQGYRNCYKVQFLVSNTKFIFRATFYYGNYDGLSKPPSFGIELNGKLWANVTTSMSEEPVVHELIYTLKEENMEMCLVRTLEDNVPFISSLEAIIMQNAYNSMDNTTSLLLQSRINYGANASVEKLITYSNEIYGRFWKSVEMPEYLNIHESSISPSYLAYEENSPPWQVLGYAIKARNITESLYLPMNLTSQIPIQAYFVFYFFDPLRRSYPGNETSRVEIYIDNKKMADTVVPNGSVYTDRCRIVSFYPVQVSGYINLTIAPAEGSTLPPILNAMEIYSSIDLSKGVTLLDCKRSLIVFVVLFWVSYVSKFLL